MSKTKTINTSAKPTAVVNTKGGFVGRDYSVNRLLFNG
jgi:hypothetical protein